MRFLALFASFVSLTAHAHSASDAFLTLDRKTTAGDTVIEAQWDIALRDLHFVKALDDDGDGAITWGEVKRHRADIESYAYERLKASADGVPCTVDPARLQASARSDGTYAALFFRIVCKGNARRVTLDYRLLFDVDPTHRGILVYRSAGATATSLFSPENARVDLRVEAARP